MTAENNPAILQHEVADWIESAFGVLRESAWTMSAYFHGIDCLDALRQVFFMDLLELARAFDAPPHRSSIGPWKRLRSWGFQGKELWEEWQTVRLARNRPLPTSVLLWPRHSTHVKMLVPIARALRERGVACEFLSSLPRIWEILRAAEEPSGFTPAIWPGEIKAARADGRRMAGTLPLDLKVSLPDFVRPVPQEALRQCLHRTFRRWLPALYETIVATERALDELRPRVLVVGNDLTFEGRAQCLVASKRAISTACPMHGLAFGPLQRDHRTDCVLAFGERSRRDLIRLGVPPDRIAICGAPYLMGRSRQTGQTNPAIARFLELQPRQPWVLVATSGAGHSVSAAHHQQIVDALAAESAANRGVRFAVKLHLKDTLEYYTEAQRKFPNAHWSIVGAKTQGVPQDIFAWLQGPAAVLTCASTVGMEAILLKIPVISMDFADELKDVDYIESGASLHVTNRSELHAAIQRVLNEPQSLGDVRERMAAYLRDCFEAIDGDAAGLTAEKVCQLGGISFVQKNAPAEMQ